MGINDVIIHQVDRTELKSGHYLTILRETDPLLRRFGQCDLLILEKGEKLVFSREQADEFWAVVDGQVSFTMEDTRSESPSFQQEQYEELTGETPRLIMVPFGVRCKVHAELPSTLVRLATHQDGTHPGDQTQLSLFD
jgi:dTDP-4-dehydrorhamnose 3,5-epimerase-like enzyme